MENWYALKDLEVPWFVYGLLINDSTSAFAGKSKSGKSCLIRNLAAAVIKNRKFLGREVFVPKGEGRVLYIHLDRKDPVRNVAKSLRMLGITEEEHHRLRLMSAEDMPKGETERKAWFLEQVKAFNPHLVIIDLLYQFICTENSNDYNRNLGAINELQDALRGIAYQGHLVTAHHARKATGALDPFDDLMGTSAIRGSMSTSIKTMHDRKNHRYTIQTDQTERADSIGELDETVIERDPETGWLSLGISVAELEFKKKKEKAQTEAQDLFHFIERHPGQTEKFIIEKMGISKTTFGELYEETKSMVERVGKGRRGNPYRFSVPSLGMEASV